MYVRMWRTMSVDLTILHMYVLHGVCVHVHLSHHLCLNLIATYITLHKCTPLSY